MTCELIANFYRVYHSTRYVSDLLVMRLNMELSDDNIAQLNQEFSDIILQGKITKSAALPPEIGDLTQDLPRIVFYFNQKDLGRLYQMINQINQWGEQSQQNVNLHPERK